VDLAGRVDIQLGEQGAGGLGQFGALPVAVGRAGEGTQVDAFDLAAHDRPGCPAVFSATWMSRRAGQHRRT